MKRPFVVVANHSSHLDAPLIMGALPRPLARYLAAGAAGDYFFDVWWRRGLTALFFNAFPVDRSGNNPRNVSAKTLLEHDVPVLVFPEGTRSKNGIPGHFKPGAAALSSSTGAPILPIAIIGAHESHPRGSKWPTMGLPVGVVFGSPMTAQPDENPTQFMARVRDQVVAMHTEHSARILDPKHSRRKEEEVTDVKHMKWWGWGNEGVGFHWQDKPGFADFVQYAVGLDLHTAEPVGMPSFDKMTIPKSLAGKPLLGTLATIVGEGHVTTDDMERVVHVYGKSLRDLVRIRANQVQRYPDVVVYPADEAEVQKIVDAAVAADVVIIPFGGGSNIAGSLEPRADEKRVILSLDMGRLREVIEIDEESGLARIQAGAQGPDLEEQLNAKGWTIGHFPDSFTHSTLGGWVATRSSGMQSDKYGDISDIARGLRVVRPGGTLVVRPHPVRVERPERQGDDPRQRGPPRRHHRGHRAGAPRPREARRLRLLLPELGCRHRRHAGDRGVRRGAVDHPRSPTARRPASRSRRARSATASTSSPPAPCSPP